MEGNSTEINGQREATKYSAASTSEKISMINLHFAASHSLRSSPEGRIMASLMSRLLNIELLQYLITCCFESMSCFFRGFTFSLEQLNKRLNI